MYDLWANVVETIEIIHHENPLSQTSKVYSM